MRKSSPLSTLYSPLLHSPLFTLHSPLSTLHSSLSTSQLFTLHSPLSTWRLLSLRKSIRSCESVPISAGIVRRQLSNTLRLRFRVYHVFLKGLPCISSGFTMYFFRIYYVFLQGILCISERPNLRGDRPQAVVEHPALGFIVY